MNELRLIENFDGINVEIIRINGMALFNPYHVGECLDLSESNVRNYLSSMNNKQALTIKNSDVRNLDIRKLNNRGEKFLTKSGVYKLIFKSRKPEAERFQDWVTDDILPQIELTGGYVPIEEDEPNEVFLARAVKIANTTIEKKDEIIAAQKKRISSLEETEKDWKLLMDTKGTFSVNEVAHFIGIGEYKLFARLREIGICFKNENGDNVPYERPVHRGKFMACPAIAPDGTAHLQTRVYPEGIAYITKQLRKHGYLEVA